MKRTSINKLIRKVLLNNKKLFAIWCVLFFLVFALIDLTYALENIRNEKKYVDGHEIYGSMQFIIKNIDREVAEEISKMPEVAKSQIYTSAWSMEDNALEYYATEDILDLSQWNLYKGRFPSKKNEMVCDSRFLAEREIHWEDHKEIIITYNNKKYYVTGIINRKSNSIDNGSYTSTLFFYSEDKIMSNAYHDIMIKTNSRDYMSLVKSILKEFNLSDRNVEYNESFLRFAEIDENNITTNPWDRISKIVIYISLVLFIYIVMRVLQMILNKEIQNYKIMMAMGISFNTIKIEMLKILAFITVIFGIIGMILGIICTGIISGNYEISFFANYIECVMVNILALVEIFLVFYFMFYERPKIVNQLSNPEKIKVPKNKLSFGRPERFARNVGKSVMRTKRMKYIGYALLIIITMSMLNMYTYSAKDILDSYDENVFDYRVEYNLAINEQMREVKALKDLYIDMEKQDGKKYNLIPVHVEDTNVRVQKQKLSQSYKDFLMNQSEEKINMLRANDNRLYRDFSYFVYVDDKTMEELFGTNTKEGLKDDECYITKSIRTKEGMLEWGFKEGDSFEYEYYKNSGEELTKKLRIKGVVGDFKLDLPYMNSSPIIIVNKKTYDDVVEFYYPRYLYINAIDGNYEAVEKSLESAYMINLVDMRREKEISEQNYRNISTKMYGVFTALIFLVLINMILIANDTFNSNKMQIATLNAIGVERGKIMRMFLYTNVKIMVIALILGNVISYVACFFMYLNMDKQLEIYFFKPPYESFILFSLLFVVLIIVQTIYICLRIKRMDISKILSNE